MSVFGPDDVVGRINLIILVIVFAIIALLEWLFGHPTREDWRSLGLFLGWMATMVIIGASFESVERRLKNIERKLDAISKER